MTFDKKGNIYLTDPPDQIRLDPRFSRSEWRNPFSALEIAHVNRQIPDVE